MILSLLMEVIEELTDSQIETMILKLSAFSLSASDCVSHALRL